MDKARVGLVGGRGRGGGSRRGGDGRIGLKIWMKKPELLDHYNQILCDKWIFFLCRWKRFFIHTRTHHMESERWMTFMGVAESEGRKVPRPGGEMVQVWARKYFGYIFRCCILPVFRRSMGGCLSFFGQVCFSSWIALNICSEPPRFC